MLTRRDALQRIAMLVGAVAVAPDVGLPAWTDIPPPVIDWTRWNQIDLYADGDQVQLCINGLDVTGWPQMWHAVGHFFHWDPKGDLTFGTPGSGITMASDGTPFNWVRFHVRVRKPWTDLDDMVVG